MDRDDGNLTYIHTVESLWSEEGEKFQREKYVPRIELLKRYLRPAIGEARMLDVGVGYGFFLQLLEKDYGVKELYGMDPYPDSIAIASERTSAKIEKGDINDVRWPFEERSFDVITSFDVVEHLEDPSAFFRKAGAYLREGGLVLVTTPNKELPYLMRAIPW
ncbi:MAG TPA: class I SAM-dependent methyltransferase, partial [Candidatus Krumholzibacterium sp.]|nr:class I SAM-dependent methyltransferase [Candidatus Krumholzibacterium sp.]